MLAFFILNLLATAVRVIVKSRKGWDDHAQCTICGVAALVNGLTFRFSLLKSHESALPVFNRIIGCAQPKLHL
jgi:hypothetical protein